MRSELFTDAQLLEFLDLSRNKIISVQPNLFNGLTHLVHLNLSGNRLEVIPDNLFSDTKNIQTIDLSFNSLTSLGRFSFYYLRKLQRLNLTQNRLTHLPSTVFKNCMSLVRLELGHNSLQELHYTSFPDGYYSYFSPLTYLDLSHNNISINDDQPVFFLNRQVNLEHLLMSNNRIDKVSYFQIVYTKLETLDLSYNLITNLSLSKMGFTSNHMKLNLSYNHITSFHIDIWGPNLFLELSLEGNVLVCDCNLYKFARIAQGLPLAYKLETKISVKDIDRVPCYNPDQTLADTSLKTVDTETLTCPEGNHGICDYSWREHDKTLIANCSYRHQHQLPVLQPITTFSTRDISAVTLDLTNNSITSLKGFLGPSLGKLDTLILANNKLSALTLDELSPDLKALDLRGNNLTLLELPVLEHFNRTNMELSLGHNPWECDCDLLPFMTFLHVPSRKVRDFEDLHCGSDGEPLMELTEHDLCPFFLQPMVLITIITILVCLIIFAVLGTVSFYRYQQGIKVWLFTHRICLWAITEDELDADKKYDAFISYSHKDEEFVNKVLVPGLESGEPKYRVCLHYRDWVPGLLIQDQIMNSVESSRRTLVVLSPNFIESVWGQLEFRAAHSKALQDGTNRIIVIIHGEIPPEKALDEKLRLYVSMRTYVRWGDAKFWEKLRYLMPHSQELIQKKQGKRQRKDTDKLELCKSDSKQSV
ncbi:hypothetical protein Pcinc_032341 [Petrolisthes cinctipes]|uniref:TIR domain-containing protein n=1 Tax=Petrolisthes cinctipes TaxID=88211 RepID=A0AAE1EUT0_PETCI|nr:hypothetical protein Pcinc_032341 [Petrolisthes cinctipes]